jgi:hypothetical protein
MCLKFSSYKKIVVFAIIIDIISVRLSSHVHVSVDSHLFLRCWCVYDSHTDKEL